MYVITNRRIDDSESGLGQFGKSPNDKGQPKRETLSKSTRSTTMRDLFLDLPWCHGSGQALKRAGVAGM